MASSQTEGEVRAEYRGKMGPELGELQYLLWHDLTTLHLKWSELRELFGTSQRRLDLMNETAPRFFGRVKDALWNDVLLHLCHLTDPPNMGRHQRQNLTFERFPPLVAHLPIRDAIHAALAKVKSTTHFARDWRNRRLAHRDFNHAQDPTAQPLPTVASADVEAALNAMQELMQILEAHFLDRTVSYERTSSAQGGAWDMLFHLDSGLDAIRSRKAERIRWEPKYL